VIAEDQLLLRDGLSRLLRDNGLDVVAAVGDAPALLDAVAEQRPEIAIVDIRMPPDFRDEGLRAALQIRSSHPDTAVLILSQYVEPAYAAELLADGRGQVGYLLKDRVFDVADFIEAVHRVGEGGAAHNPQVMAHHV
jgi:DNA-binding NarL/FixJ family response regulator